MATDIVIPSVGESVSEGTIARWLKHDGDQVRQGEPLVEIETDKATTEVPAPASGTLRIRANEGQAVQVGGQIGAIEEGASDGAEKRKATEPKAQPRVERSEESDEKEAKAEAPARASAVPAREPAPPKPASRRLGEDGEARKPAPSGDEGAKEPAAGERRQPLSAIRQRIAERLLQSQNSTATLTTFNEADLTAVLEIRARHREDFRSRHGVDLGLMSFFVKACVQALRKIPVVNAWIDGNEIVYHNSCHIGIAVSTEKGLMVPVLRNAERLSFAEIEKGIAELAKKAREGKLTVNELQGGTFTITNGGVFGSLLSTPILNPPQSAILGMHTIQKRPVAVGDQVVIRPMMYLALSYDHRLIDGREAVQFLVQVKEAVENPIWMLLGSA
jgi:2-oxoglutarate dehydrogenase E2 component (dihydrolipoamide succinyltransferase)